MSPKPTLHAAVWVTCYLKHLTVPLTVQLLAIREIIYVICKRKTCFYQTRFIEKYFVSSVKPAKLANSMYYKV